MKVLIDTSVWSLVLRRKSVSNNSKSIEQELSRLMNNGSVELIGAIRQEILSGISSEIVFNKLVIALQEYSDLLINSDIHVKAAECFNICRSKGVQGSHTDFLICAVSIFYNIPIFTLDKDFENYKNYLPILLHDYQIIKTNKIILGIFLVSDGIISIKYIYCQDFQGIL